MRHNFVSGTHTLTTALFGVLRPGDVIAYYGDLGAGKTAFTRGLAVGLAEGRSLEEAAAFGSKAASIACTRRGAAQSVPTREETDNYKA